jgi:hypothetical protein
MTRVSGSARHEGAALKRSHVTWLVGAALLMSAGAGAVAAAAVVGDDEAEASEDGGVELTYRAGLGAPEDTTVGAPASGATTPSASGPAPGATVDPTSPTGSTIPMVVEVTVPPTTIGTSSADDGLNPFGGDSPEDRLMPSVICMNLQEAQDEIQDHGVFFSHSEDATGEGRRQLWDRNWQVIDQSPAPGEPIGEGDAVLYVVKYDDDHPNPC